MSSSNPDNSLTSAEIEHLNKLETIVQRGLDTDLELGNALADISDATLYRATHPTFEAYLRDRWGIHHSPDYQLSQAAELTEPPPSDLDASARATEPEPRPLAPARDDGPDSLTNVWEQSRHVFDDDGVTPVDIPVTVHGRDQPPESKPEPCPTLGPLGDSEAGELLARLGWLLTHSTGAIAEVAHNLETRAADLDDDAREQLRDDVLALHDELATLKALLQPVDWDAEHGRLLAGQIPPFGNDPDDERDQ